MRRGCGGCGSRASPGNPPTERPELADAKGAEASSDGGPGLCAGGVTSVGTGVGTGAGTQASVQGNAPKTCQRRHQSRRRAAPSSSYLASSYLAWPSLAWSGTPSASPPPASSYLPYQQGFRSGLCVPHAAACKRSNCACALRLLRLRLLSALICALIHVRH